ncbi:ATP-citrate synthase-like [Penaeus indicus]|uniref:ATP-citrate synthase-like n=1 Tax=Penaeus indicus TaxID=29960 RepID=UPI00300C85B9
MSAKAIREATGKALLQKNLPAGVCAPCRYAAVTEDTQWDALATQHPWLSAEKLVVKPDQLIKRRGKLGLIKVGTDLAGAKAWVGERMNKDQKLDVGQPPVARRVKDGGHFLGLVSGRRRLHAVLDPLKEQLPKAGGRCSCLCCITVTAVITQPPGSRTDCSGASAKPG